MEALGGAASIITVTTIALQSAKAVYATVHGIKNGPKEVNDLASAVNNLSDILEQVVEISNMFSDTDGTDLSGLTKVVEECDRSLADIRKQVEKLDVLSDERRLEKAWKRVKFVVQKEDFRRMWVTVHYYISVFGTHLSVVGRRRDHNHNTDLARHMRQTGTDSEVLKQNNEMLKQVENGLSGLESGLTRQETQRKLDTRHIKAGHEAAESLGERLNDLASMSMGQSETMMEKLVQIQNQIEELKASTVHTQEMFTPKVSFSDNSREEKAENHTDDNHAGDELSESIDRLCGLATKPKTTAFSDEAQQIITDLEKILSLVSREAKSTEARETRKRKQDQLADLECAEASRYSKQDLDLKRLRGLLISSPCISLNEQASFDTNITSEIRRYRKTAFQNYVTDIGAISVQVKKRRLLKNAGQDEKSIPTTKPDEEIEDIFEGTVTLMPKKNDCRTKVSTSFLQRSTKDGFFSLRPRLSFCAIIPDNSEIFALVRNGDLKGIINHLQQGKASLSDCDPEGRSLLNYALFHVQVEICEFLIDKGADIEAAEPNFDHGCGDFDLSAVESPLNRFYEIFNDCDCDEQEFASVLNCRRLLLNAGADPMPRGSLGDLFSSVNGSTSEPLAIILNLGGEFINYESKDELGRTMLLLYANGFGHGVNPHSIKLLLDRGASVMARDNWGSTCLHIAVDSIRCRQDNVLDRVSLLIMIEAGADVYAINNSGKSVSDVAYTYNDQDKRRNLGTYRGDLWDEVLTECGYDAAWFREDFRRRHPAAVQRLVQELGEFSDVDERESMVGEQDSEIGWQDPDNTEIACDVLMEDANIQRNSPDTPEEGLKLPGIEEIWGANIWSQRDTTPEASASALLPSAEDQHIFSWTDPSYLQDEASVSPTFQESYFLDTEDSMKDGNVWA